MVRTPERFQNSFWFLYDRHMYHMTMTAEYNYKQRVKSLKTELRWKFKKENP